MPTLFRTIKDFRHLYKTTSVEANVVEFTECGLSISWLGYPYAMFDVPSEFFTDKINLDSYIGKKLNDYVPLLEKYRIAHIVFPNTVVDYKTHRVLVVFEPDLTWITNFFKLIKILFFIGLGALAVYIIFQIFGLWT
jgi:hypothetical protein